MQFSNIQLKRGSRFVQSDDVLFTAGGLTSGIDLTLHIVEKFYGRKRQTVLLLHTRSSARENVSLIHSPNSNRLC
jgi:transcriptional regulator GlxA family with amidase domain